MLEELSFKFIIHLDSQAVISYFFLEPLLTIDRLYLVIGAHVMHSCPEESFPCIFYGFYNLFEENLNGLKYILKAMTYGNSGSLPLVMVETLSRQPPLSDDEESLQKLTTYLFVQERFYKTSFFYSRYIFMYLTAWFLSFWSIGLLYMRNGWEIGSNIM